MPSVVRDVASIADRGRQAGRRLSVSGCDVTSASVVSCAEQRTGCVVSSMYVRDMLVAYSTTDFQPSDSNGLPNDAVIAVSVIGGRARHEQRAVRHADRDARRRANEVVLRDGARDGRPHRRVARHERGGIDRRVSVDEVVVTARHGAIQRIDAVGLIELRLQDRREVGATGGGCVAQEQQHVGAREPRGRVADASA